MSQLINTIKGSRHFLKCLSRHLATVFASGWDLETKKALSRD